MNTIVEALMSFWHVWMIGSLLAIVTFDFVLRFVLPGDRLGRELRDAIAKLSEIKRRVDGNLVELDELTQGPMQKANLANCWSEYAETLHRQKEESADGQHRIIRWRATALAETFFSEHAIITIPLKVDFYKHVPGILTGLGIIGTFLGLIIGLSTFDVSYPAQAQSQLKNLINAVGHAFVISGIAIGLAMLFTWIEKSIVTARSRELAELRQTLDSLFEAGAGEEYLERLVHASENQATQAIQIKDALVADLKQLLDELANHMSQNVGQAIAQHLGGPINSIATAVERVRADQGEAVHQMLTDVLASFSAKMEEMFGDQMRGMTDLLQQTADAMREIANQFSKLAADMDAAGSRTVETMGERLNYAITSLEARQHAMNKQMGEFVTQIREMIQASQGESARALQETLGQLGAQTEHLFAQLHRQTEDAQQTHEQAVTTLSAQMERLMAQSIETKNTLQETVAALSRAVNDAIERMNQGAETLHKAASDFAKAGEGVTKTMQSATEASANMQSTAATLSRTASAAAEVLADYARTRDVFAAMVANLESVIENARKEASLTEEIISRFQQAAEILGETKRQADEYLKQVNEVLAKTHQDFAAHVSNTMREANRTFQQELEVAVRMVSDAVKELGETLEDISVRER